MYGSQLLEHDFYELLSRNYDLRISLKHSTKKLRS